MTIARSFSRIVRRNLRFHGAWLPVVSSFALGDFGFFEGGVFRRLGNVRDRFGIGFETRPGSSASLDFQTKQGTTIKLFVEGQGEVPTLPDANVEARIDFTFARAHSFLLKAPRISSSAVSDIAGLAEAISHLNRGDWDLRYKVVTELLVAEDATMVATQSRDTTVSIVGKANVLRRFLSGEMGTSLDVVSNRSLSLQIAGGTGPCALGLARVRRRGGVVPLGNAAAAVDPLYEGEDTDDQLEVEDDI